jgi:hypothetical protein
MQARADTLTLDGTVNEMSTRIDALETSIQGKPHPPIIHHMSAHAVLTNFRHADLIHGTTSPVAATHSDA